MNKREFSPLEKAQFFFKKSLRDASKIRRSFYRNYSEQLEDFASSTGYGHEFEDLPQYQDLFDYPSIADDKDVFKRYVKKRWIARQAGRNNDVITKHGKVIIKNYGKYEKSYKEFIKRSGYMGGKP